MVTLMVLEPWTGISTTEGIAGFANEATITVLAMLILSAGVSQTGVVQLLGSRLAEFAGTDLRKQLFATIGVAGPASGFVNNTPVVAILVPVITDLAHEGKTSPSKLLIPLSYASMLGGMLTLIGTSTNILASNVAGRLAERTGNPRLHAFSMFEFTGLGLIVLVVGGRYLLFVGHRLLPERVPPEEDYIEEYDMEDYLTEVQVAEGSPFVGQTVEAAIDEAVFDAEIIQLVRGDETFIEPIGQKTIRADDVLTLRIDKPTLKTLTTTEHLTLVGTPTEAEIDPGEEQTLVEVVIPSGSALVGETLSSSTFRERYNAAVLAFRSRGEVIHERPEQVTDSGRRHPPRPSVGGQHRPTRGEPGLHRGPPSQRPGLPNRENSGGARHHRRRRLARRARDFPDSRHGARRRGGHGRDRRPETRRVVRFSRVERHLPVSGRHPTRRRPRKLRRRGTPRRPRRGQRELPPGRGRPLDILHRYGTHRRRSSATTRASC